MKKTVILPVLLVIALFPGCTFLKINITPEPQPLEEQVLSGTGREKVLIIDISGMITSEQEKNSLSGKKEAGMLPLVREQLDRARADRNVKGLVLRINSPGGGVTASDVLYHEIAKFKKETGAAVIAHIMDTGASGAYYAALAADSIRAQPTSIVGSIGVILWRVDATGLLHKAGIGAQEIASGDLKGMGSPFRPITAEEKILLRKIIDSLHDRFVALVAERRSLDRARAAELSDGRVFTAGEALEAGLIDETGYLDDAIEAAKKRAGLGKDARAIIYYRPGDYKSTIYSGITIDINAVLDPGARFLYLWNP